MKRSAPSELGETVTQNVEVAARTSPEFVDWVRTGRFHGFERALGIVVAHPDDEVIGAGGQLPKLENVAVIHVTDGAPRNLLDATRAGFSSCGEYARARRAELHKALLLAGLDPSCACSLDVADQGASFELVSVTRRLVDLFTENKFDAVLTHPYEGGHPDHDATAFAVHAACRLLQRLGKRAPSLTEMTSYHNSSGAMGVGTFLPCKKKVEITTVPLSVQEQRRKRDLLACFVTQQATLRSFTAQCECERFRPAPAYDFTAPPHDGILYYELFDWGVTGGRWRELAQGALETLGIGSAE